MTAQGKLQYAYNIFYILIKKLTHKREENHTRKCFFVRAIINSMNTITYVTNQPSIFVTRQQKWRSYLHVYAMRKFCAQNKSESIRRTYIRANNRRELKTRKLRNATLSFALYYIRSAISLMWKWNCEMRRKISRYVVRSGPSAALFSCACTCIEFTWSVRSITIILITLFWWRRMFYFKRKHFFGEKKGDGQNCSLFRRVII